MAFSWNNNCTINLFLLVLWVEWENIFMTYILNTRMKSSAFSGDKKKSFLMKTGRPRERLLHKQFPNVIMGKHPIWELSANNSPY